MEYKEEDYLQLSGIQHFLFCRRQWALIHIEQQWAENVRKADGRWLHKNAHKTGERIRRGDLLIIKGMKIHSHTLGLSGECDVVEFHRDDQLGVEIYGEEGKWMPFPVEYKRGKMKPNSMDTAQLCAQAVCLEEMLCCKIQEGAIFYGEIRRRVPVIFDDTLREQVRITAEEMHNYFRNGYTPKSKRTKSCNACSLLSICMPQLSAGNSVTAYIKSELCIAENEEDGMQ